MNHLSMTYVEGELENQNMGKILQSYAKISPECVMQCHPGPIWVKKLNTTSKCHPIGQNPAPLKNEVDEDDNTDDENIETEESFYDYIEDDQIFDYDISGGFPIIMSNSKVLKLNRI